MRSSNLLRRLLSSIGPFAIAFLLLYLAFRGTNTDDFRRVFESANYLWLVPLGLITLLSHWLRAVRWTIFLKALPGRSDQRISKNTAFGALIVGYMVNYATPRLGEVARSVIASRREKIDLPSVAGTVVVDRVIDVASLLIALVSVLFILRNDTSLISDSIVEPSLERLGALPGYVWVLSAVILAILAITAVRIARSNSTKIQQIYKSFTSGILSVFRSDQPMAIVGLTLAMWVCYICMALLPFNVLQIADSYSVTITVAWVVMIIGSLGIAVPSPGGIGSYHYITILALTALYGFSQPDAAAYAFLAHGAQFVLYTLVGFAYVIFFGTGLNFRSPSTAEESVEEEVNSDHA